MSVVLSPDHEPIPGYKLIKRLGRGGFGEVWEVEAPGGIRKAMKFVFGDLDNIDDENTRAAAQELKSLDRIKNIRHPYILSTEQWLIQNGQLIIIMELAECNLWDRFKERRGLGMIGIPRDELLSYLAEAAEALDLMNTKFNLQHLDIKPQNLFLVYNHVKVADFGLAKVFEGQRATVTGGVTPVYAGPETFEGYVSRYTDQYSLAIVFQELLTGTRPFNGSNTKQLVMQHLNGTPDLEAVPVHDRPILMQALAKKPSHRWPSCAELINQLKAAGRVTQPVGKPSSEPIVTTNRAEPPSDTVPVETRGLAVGARIGIDQQTRMINRTGLGIGVPNATPTRVPVPTPRLGLVTPQAAASNSMPSPSVHASAITLQRPIVTQTMRRDSLNLAPPERTSDGILMPALIVGLGHSGILAVRSLKQIIRSQFGAEPLPHLKFLCFDTDPASQQFAMGPGVTEPLASNELIISKLQRPAHYLQRDGLPSVEQWMPQGVLYRLSRTPQGTEGVRAFGRLALMDAHRTLMPRIRQELETFISDQPLDDANRRTQLGLRSNRPRVYIIANLAGGTGSGAFLDMAYLLKHELRLCGFVKPEVVAELLVPPADKTAQRGRSLANTYAALQELHHFHQGRAKYQVRFDNGTPLQDEEGPFSRCNLVQLSKRVEPHELLKTVGLVARSIFHDLLTATGRVTDSIRHEAFALNRDRQSIVQAQGIYRLSWPRFELLTHSTQRFGQKLIQRWTAKEAGHLKEPIQAWLNEQWTKRKLELEVVVEGFNTAVHDALRDDPDRVFNAYIDPLRQRTPNASRLEPEAVCRVLEQLLKLVGKPAEYNLEEQESSIQKVLDERFKKVTSDAEQHLSAMAVAFLEQPQYRLSGAEEAIHQLAERLERIISGLDAVRKDLSKEIFHLYERLFPSIGSLSQNVFIGTLSGRKGLATSEVLDLLVQYPQARLKLMILESTLSVYRSLQSALPEYVREIAMCRNKLLEMVNALANQSSKIYFPTGPGRMILPPGIEGLEGAADLFLGALPPEDILDFDANLQKHIAKKFRSLVSVCVKAEFSQPFLQLLTDEAFAFLNARLEQADPVAAFFRYRCDEPEQMQKMLHQAFEHAAPDVTSLSGRAQTEITLLACPDTTDGHRFGHLVSQLLRGTELMTAPLEDTIAFIREYPLLPMTELAQLGPHAHEAYLVQQSSELTPHTRADITWSPVNELAASASDRG